MSDNDISELLRYFDASMLMRIAFCSVSCEEVTEIIEKLGKVEIDIGDGLTLLHQAAQFDRGDLVDLLLGRNHPVEVLIIFYYEYDILIGYSAEQFMGRLR